MNIREIVSKILGIQDKMLLVVYSILGVGIFTIGFIMGAWLGNPRIYLYIQDGNVTRKERILSPPEVVSHSYAEGSSCPVPFNSGDSEAK